MKKHYLITLAILAATAAVHFSIERAQAVAGMAKPPEEVLHIPSRVGPYEQMGTDAEIDPRVKVILETSLILERLYMSPQGMPVRLSIVYAGVSRRSLHFPEVCIVGAGWEILEQESMPIGFKFDAKRLVLVKGNQQQAVVYWFKTGDQLTGNFFENSWAWAKNQITFGAPTSALIKLSAPLSPGREQAVFSILEDFAIKFTPILLKNIH